MKIITWNNKGYPASAVADIIRKMNPNSVQILSISAEQYEFYVEPHRVLEDANECDQFVQIMLDCHTDGQIKSVITD